MVEFGYACEQHPPSLPAGAERSGRLPAWMTTASWWQSAIIYQVYPRSFADASGDGIGDLRGIRNRIVYLTDLNVDAIWLSPIYPSPMADFGYDIADYENVDPRFGTLTDLDELVQAAHARGIRVILDLVPNHTSDEHPWFIESRSSRRNVKRSWYMWRDPAPDGGPPNNWESLFGGPAWEWDAATGQYYLHLFHKKQPDLNWRNRDVRSAMYGTMRFWLDRGIDGFRIDVLWLLVKDPDFRDNPPRVSVDESELTVGRYDRPMYEDLPETHAVVHEMRAVADEYHGRVLIGEIYLPLQRLVRYYGDNLRGIHLPFNFSLLSAARWDAPNVRTAVDAYELALPPGAWPNWVLGNHDVRRIATRAGADGARVAQMLLLTLRGTPTCYYGDELGMPDADLPLDESLDPQASVGFDRNACRTPMQWDASPNAGFSAPGVTPWLPVQQDYQERNVALQMSDPRSQLALFRKLAALRRNAPALTFGDYRVVNTGGAPGIFGYMRVSDRQRVLVLLNFAHSEQRLDLTALGASAAVLCSSNMDRDGRADLATMLLRGHEGLILQLD